MEKIEIPPGLIRTWKAFVICALGNIAFFFAGAGLGHSTARVETKEVRVEVPYPERCTDTMIPFADDKVMQCAHPDQNGHFEMVGKWNTTFLVCSCSTPQISLEAGAR